jgi:glucose-1-phosphate thymidylyltransferase
MAKKMKGVILAGGTGSRLFPNTKVTNKHLLPVYNQPMIYYPIQTLMRAGITDILIMPGKDNAGDFAKLLGSGKEFNANFSFKVQDHAGGLAYAVSLAEDFVGENNFTVVFGDNIIEDCIVKDVQNFEEGAKIFLKQVSDPERFGIAEIDGDKILNIVEKPKKPKTDWAAIGLYMYDSLAFEYIKKLKPSERGELEITDLNNIYVKKGLMKAGFLKGYWYDAGTHESLVEAAYKLKQSNKPRNLLSLEQKNSPKVVVGSVLYDSEDGKYKTSKYLPYLLPSIRKQSYQNISVVFVDNNKDKNNDNVKYIKAHYPEAKIIHAGENLGFAKANNILVEEARKLKADYFLTSNPDMVFEPNAVTELVYAVMKTPQIASATCKVKRWDFNRCSDDNLGKTNFIDTVGIGVTREHRFIDRGQGDIDHGQYDSEEEIFGTSGAVAIYRMSALDDVAFIREDGTKEYFDELMFMYKEDVDLAYRLQWAGYKSIYTPKSTIYHDRSIESKGQGVVATIKSRRGRNKKYKEWSWLNHHIILQKLMDGSHSNEVRYKTFWYEVKSNCYTLFFETYLVKQWWQLFKLRKPIRERREQIKRRIKTQRHIESLMER